VQVAPPTWVTLHRLTQVPDVAAALDDVARHPIEIFETTISKTAGGALAALWAGDAGYESGDADAPGARHRLLMQDGGWVYERDER
jgi:hypothetical protein